MGKFKKLQNKRKQKEKQQKTINKSKNIFGKFATDLEKQKLGKQQKLNKQLILAANEKQNKASSFKDHRLQKKFNERIKQNTGKKYLFDLQDNDEIILTHNGKSLDEVKHFDGYESDTADDMPQELVQELNFDDQNQSKQKQQNQQKSKKQIYEEIIKKSKQAKYEKAKQKEQDLENLDQVNEDLRSISKFLQFRDKKAPTEQDENDDYNKLARELEYEHKNQPTIIKSENNKKQEKRDKKKQKQIEGIMSSEDENEFVNDDETEVKAKREKNIVKQMKKAKNITNFQNELRNQKDLDKDGSEESEQDSLDYVYSDEEEEMEDMSEGEEDMEEQFESKESNYLDNEDF